MQMSRIAGVLLTFGFCLPVFADEPAQDVTLEDLFGPPAKTAPETESPPPIPLKSDPLDSLYVPFQDQPTSKPATEVVSEDDSPSKAELLRRIEQLEKRLAEIEAKQPQTPQALPPRPTPDPSTPKFRRKPSPRDAVPYNPQPNLGVPTPIDPPARTAPPHWKKFRFNGEDYYYIPVKDVPHPVPTY